jgi:aldose 1-epimerase
MRTKKGIFGVTKDGSEVALFTLECDCGARFEFISYGAALKSVRVPAAKGTTEITYGFDTLAEYEENRFFFGATIGRFGNRIAHGKFFISDVEYSLARNNGNNHLHGGELGFDRRVWKSVVEQTANAASVVFAYNSPAGEEGYPGNLQVTVTYTVTDNGELSITYQGKTDEITPFNPTNHTFWNIAGADAGSIADLVLELNCPLYIPVNDELIPTGEILSVKNTPMDFLKPKAVGKDIEAVKPAGYDHCFVIAPESGGSALKFAARITDPKSGRRMEVFTTMPGMHVYSGNFIKNAKIAGGLESQRRGAICFETEFFPDSVNQPHFPSVLLEPGKTFFSKTVYRF